MQMRSIFRVNHGSVWCRDSDAVDPAPAHDSRSVDLWLWHDRPL